MQPTHIQYLVINRLQDFTDFITTSQKNKYVIFLPAYKNKHNKHNKIANSCPLIPQLALAGGLSLVVYPRVQDRSSVV